MHEKIIQKDIVVIGAGLTGLSLSFYLNKYGKDFLTIEKLDRPGGYINTQKKGGFVYESGPNTGVLSNPETIELFNEVSDIAHLEVASDEVKKRYILKSGKWQALPMGIKSAITTPLFTFKDKLRILGEPFRPKGKNEHETLSNMVKRRLGISILEYAVDPFILGIYAGDPDYLVPKYALPKLYHLESNYGSFIKGSLKIAKVRKKDPRWNNVTRQIFSFENGLSSLTDALFDKSGRDHFVFDSKDVRIIFEDKKFKIIFEKEGDIVIVKCNQVVTTCGAHDLNKLLTFLPEHDLKVLTNLKYARVIEVSLGFNKWNGIKLDGFGGLIPHKEQRNLLGVLFLSAFLKNRAPQKGALLTVFMGGTRNDKLIDLTNNKIKKIIENEIKDLMKLPDFKPDLFEYKHYNHAIPQYGIETGERLNKIQQVQNKYPGLILAGNICDGIGMADRIKQAKTVSDIILKNSRNVLR